MHHLLLGDAPRFPQYKLVCTGHSLGAGVAAMLSILLEPALLARTIELRCMCFSPPGCVLTKQLAEKDFITSVVVDSDIVPRLSLSSMEALRNDLLEMIARARIPKHEIFYRNFFHTQGDKDLGSSFQMISPSTSDLTSRSGLYDPNSFFHPKTCVNENEFTLQLKRYLDHQNQIKYDRERNVGGEAHLIIPGKRIIHLVKDRTLLFEESRGRRPILRRRSRRESIRRRPRRVKSYTAIWAKSEDFKEIQLSTTFFTDHIPTNVLTRLETVTEALLAATMSEK